MVDGTKPDTSKPLPPPWDRIFSLGTKAVVWGLLAGVIYLLRPFFLLLFLTFVFAYILEHGVQGLAHRIASRAWRVVLVSTVFIGTLVTVGIFVSPQIEKQGRELIESYPVYLDAFDRQIKKPLAEALPKGALYEETTEEYLRTYMFGETDAQAGTETDPTTTALEFMASVGGSIIGISSSILLSLLFSFLIVLDLPKLSRGVQGLAKTKLGFIYEEAGETILSFGLVLGRALEAQLFIALLNTILTSIGLYFLGITSNLVFLALIVFLCSFIPVAGVFLSSTPICLEALSQEGLQLMLLALGLILVIHFIEAYFLNPRIFGHHLRMNAVLVLIVLTIGGKLFGVWGLVLGLPIVNYIFGYAIRYKESAGEKAISEKAA
ncbi:MAG: AI-2E family transporter [Planctomycetota bacterium]|jgi:predicted PurR-regulated permease PerM